MDMQGKHANLPDGDGGGGGGDAPPPAAVCMPLSTLASDGDTLVSWNIGLRGLRQLVDAHRCQ